MVAYMVVVSRLRAHHRRGNRSIMRAKEPIVCMSTVFDGLTAAGTARAHQASRKYQRGWVAPEVTPLSEELCPIDTNIFITAD